MAPGDTFPAAGTFILVERRKGISSRSQLEAYVPFIAGFAAGTAAHRVQGKAGIQTMRLQTPWRGIVFRILLQDSRLTYPDTFSAEIAAAGAEVEHGKAPPPLLDKPSRTSGNTVTASGALFHETIFGSRPGRTDDCPSTVQVTGQELHSAYDVWHNTREAEIRTEFL